MRIKHDNKKGVSFSSIKIGECYFNPVTSRYCIKIAYPGSEEYPRELDVGSGLVLKINPADMVYPVEAEMNIISEDEYE